jgi:murein DD-endopeptidase MepM/ murein hydrolase activator NlpD
MAYPIPGVGISTPYGKRGSNWSCQKDSNGNGIHTGCDFACNSGTDIYAPIDGQIRHRNYGSAFGNHQFAISPDKGQPFGDGEVFFAHTTSRPSDGKYVKAGDKIADVGAEGNVTGPHLHFEYHPNTKGQWSCSVIADPQPVLDYGKTPDSGGGGSYPKPKTKDVYLDKLKYGQQDSDSVYHLQNVLNGHKLSGGSTLPLTGNYLDQTDSEVRKCQQQHGYGNDPAKKSYVGSKQADHLFDSSYTIHQHS